MSLEGLEPSSACRLQWVWWLPGKSPDEGIALSVALTGCQEPPCLPRLVPLGRGSEQSHAELELVWALPGGLGLNGQRESRT